MAKAAQSGTQSAYKGVKRAATAAHFVAVARDLILRLGYEAVSVNDIAEAAGASRSTFYLHFESKLEVATAVVQEDLRVQYGLFQRLAEVSQVDREAVRAWLVAYRRDLDERRAWFPVYNIVYRFGSAGAHTLLFHRDRCVAILGERFEAFRLEGVGAELSVKRRAAAYAILIMVERVLIEFSSMSGSPDLEGGIEYLSGALLDFIEKPIRA